MEKRAILAALLMGAVLLVYQLLFQPGAPPEGPTTGDKAPSSVAPSVPSPPRPPAPRPAARPVPPLSAPVVPPEQTATIEAPLYRARVTGTGGDLVQWDLDYRGRKPMVVPGSLGPRGLVLERAGSPPQTIPFSLSADALRLGAGQGPGELELVGEDGFGIRVILRLRFSADNYTIERVIRVENRHTVQQTIEIVLPWSAPAKWNEDQVEQFQGQHPTRTVRAGPLGVERQDIGAVEKRAGPGQWVGFESEWYLAALVPLSEGFALSEEKVSGGAGRDEVVIALRASIPTLDVGQSWEGRLVTYVGPKEHGRLKALAPNLEKSIFFGGFPLPQAWGGLPMEWVVIPILWAMHAVYAATGNYGIAIIALTVIFKVLFFPLSLKSMKSMKAMQAIQPQVNALRAKYRNDAQRLQRETMELYRKQGVNPLGGCLPMVVQIPVFYALYVALSVSVELQNSPFICIGTLPAWVPGIGGAALWICDLAAHDPTYVLPLLMGGSMFIQQKMTPTVGDPRQAKMMLMMPVLFTFMFLNLPSGLVLYWTLSNVLQIAQQYYMDRGAKRHRAPPRAAKQT